MQEVTDSPVPAVKPYRFRRIPLILCTIAIVLAPNIMRFFTVVHPGLAENRLLAVMPPKPKDYKETLEFPKKFDSYIQDQFPPRAYLISSLNYARYRMGYSNVSQVIVGRRGWMFYNGFPQTDVTIGKLKMAPHEIDFWLDSFRNRQEILAKRGTKFYMLIPPAKMSVYFERMPKWLKRAPENEVDEIAARAPSRGVTQLVYPRHSLIGQKPSTEELLYNPYDTHWTGAGAYLAYVDLMNRIAQDDPTMKPLPRSAFAPTQLPPSAIPRGLSLMLGIGETVRHEHVSYVTWPQHDEKRTTFLGPRKDWTAPQVIETDAKNQLTLLLVRDSFMLEMLPFLKPHFHTIVLSHVNDGFFPEAFIEKYKPDYFITEVLETGARYAMPAITLK